MPGKGQVAGRDDRAPLGKRIGWLAQAAAFAAYSGLMRALPVETMAAAMASQFEK